MACSPLAAPRLARLALAAGLSALSLVGCAGGTANLETQTRELTSRVGELETANRQLQLRLDAYEASLTLIEDQVSALERGGTGARHAARTDRLDVVRVEPTRAAATYATTARHDAYAELYARDAEQQADDDGDVIEIVVSDDKLEKYFGEAGSDVASTTSTGGGMRPRTAASTSARVPRPTVVTGEKLAVMPIRKDGTGRVAADASPAPTSGDAIDLYKAGLKHYRQEQFEPAIELFEQFLAAKPPADYVDNALYWLGECHYGLKQYAEAATYFHRIVQEYPDANKVPDALLKVGLTYMRLQKRDSAREVMYYLIEAYPDTEASRVARQRLDDLNAS